MSDIVGELVFYFLLGFIVGFIIINVNNLRG